MPETHLTLISSMATKALLADLVNAFCDQHPDTSIAITSVGGVDAAKRVQAGEAFDIVALASDAIDKLAVGGWVIGGTRTDMVHSAVAVAVRTGGPLPDIGSEAALKAAVLAAPTLGYSTGPSGVKLAALFDRWGIAQQIAARIVTPPPGVPVGSLVASDDVALGFQQMSELMNLPGIQVVGVLPAAVEIVTTFSAALSAVSQQPTAVRRFLAFVASPQTAELKLQHGMKAA